MENSSVASASSEAGSSRSQEIEELERFIDSYVLEYQVQGLLTDKTEGDGESDKTQSNISQWTVECTEQLDGNRSSPKERGSSHNHNQPSGGATCGPHWMATSLPSTVCLMTTVPLLSCAYHYLSVEEEQDSNRQLAGIKQLTGGDGKRSYPWLQ
ncbi:hypothetical protein FKM82_025834, partial [Ascaphus truei]